MPRYSATNHATGETVSFDWQGDKPPSQSDVRRISDAQRQSRLAAKQKVVDDESNRSFTEKLMTSKGSEYAMRAANALGLNQPWHPLDAASELGSGVKQMFTGAPSNDAQPEAHPRLAGLDKVVHGAMGIVGPPATAAGYALSPVRTGAAMLTGNLGSEAVRKGIETVVPDTSPEVKDLISTGAGLLIGAKVGHYVKEPFRNSTSSGPIKPANTSTDVLAPRRPAPRSPDLNGDNVIWEDKTGRQLPPGKVEPPTPRPFVGPRQGLPPGPEPDSVPQFNYGSRETTLPQGRDVPQLTERASPIQMPPPPIPLPPAGTAATEAQFTPPTPPQIAGPRYGAPQLTSGATQLPPAGTAAMQGNFRPLPPGLPEATPPLPISRQLPPVAPVDISSARLHDPISPSETPTVSSPAEQTPKPVRPVTTPIRPPVAPQQVPPPLPQVTPPQQPQLGVQAAPPPAPQAAPPQVPPIDDVVSQALRPTQVLPPQPKAQAPLPAVKPPLDVVSQALGKVDEPTPTTPSSEPPMQLAPAEKAQADLNNKVVNFLKLRKNVTVGQIQTQFGIPGDQARALVDSLTKRGLVTAKAGKYNYNRLPGEEVPPEATPPDGTPPPEGSPTEPQAPNANLSPYRKTRMQSLQQQIGAAEDEGDTTSGDVLRDHLRIEERNARIEQTGTPEQKATLKTMDQIYQRIDELESKESSGGNLTRAEQKELADHYLKVNKLENIASKFLKEESGGNPNDPRVRDNNAPEPRRGFFARAKFIRNLEEPGEAQPRDIRAFSAKLGSANKVLRESGIPGAVEIGRKTPLVEDLKHKFVGTYERRAADAIAGLPKQLRIEVGDILDKYADPERATGFDPRSLQAAIKLRDILDEVHGMFPDGATRGGKDIGYIPNYLTHIQRTLESDSQFKGILQDLYDYHVAPFRAIGDLFTREPLEGEGSKGPLGQSGVGRPKSPFVERRTGDLEDYERDVARVLPVYLESAAKVIYDKPWIDQAKQYLAQIPDGSKAKELATAYLRNYARYDAYPGLQQAWDTATGRLMRVVGRSVLGFDTRLWTLHTARLFSNIFPELPTKYMAYGAKKTIQSPIESYQEAGRLGLLPQNIRPWMFRRPMEKIDSISNALSIFDFIPDGVAYHGFKQMYTDAGHSPAEAARMAADKTKDVSLRVTPARAAKFFSDDLGPLKPFTQFKQQVFKIAEQYATQPLDALKRAQYDRLSRYIIGVGSMMYMYKKFRISTWHLDPFHLSTFHAAAYERFGRIIKEAANGDIEKALEDAGLLLVPGGSALKKQYEEGPSMIEPEPSLPSSRSTGSRPPRPPRPGR